MVAACGNEKRMRPKQRQLPTTEVNTTLQIHKPLTTTAGTSADAKEVSLGDTQRIGH